MAGLAPVEVELDECGDKQTVEKYSEAGKTLTY